MKPLDPRLLREVVSARRYVAATALLSLASTACVIVGAFAIGHAVAPVAQGHAGLADVTEPLTWLAASILARTALVWLRDRLGQASATAMVGELRSQVLTHASRLPHRWRTENADAVGVLTTRGLDDLVPYVTGFLPQLVLTATLTPVALAVVLWLDPLSGAVVLFTLPLIPLFMWLVGLTTQTYSRRRLAVLEQQGSQLLDLLAGLTTLRGLGRESGPSTRVESLGTAYRSTTMQTLRVAFLSGGVLELLATLSVALVAVEIGLRLVAGGLDLTTGLIVLILAPEVYLPLRSVGMQFHASANGVAAAERSFEILEVPLPSAGARPVPAWTSIEFAGISVQAGRRDYDAPHDLSALIAPGAITALAGPSGAGKTTAAMVLLLLQPPDAGSVVLHHRGGSVDLADVDPRAWWDQAVWVPQRTTMAGGTVAEHLAGAEARERDSAAHATGLADVVAHLPLGWDTPLASGEGGWGSGLSVGQTQRLELTRALLRRARLVVLDEPTAHLDAEAESDVLVAVRALADAGAAVVVIAHRPATLAAADRVVELPAVTHA